MFDRSVTAAAQEHGRTEYPREAAGLVVGGVYVPCPNLSDQPNDFFDLDPELLIKYQGRIQAVIHSHPEDWPVPSARDMRQQQAMDVPWGIYSVEKPKQANGKPVTGEVPAEKLISSPVVWFGRGAPKQPLVGRGFIHGHQDCLSEIIDCHAHQGVNLPEAPRDWEWWLDRTDPVTGEVIKAKDHYRDLFEPYGFEICEPMTPWAVWMVALGKKPDGKPILIPNHAGIYLGNGLMLHHLTASKAIDMTRLSARQPIGRWANYFNAPPIWVRHKDLPMHGLKPIA